MLEFEILARGLYRPDQLDIIYDPSLRMPTNPSIQAWMDSLWEQKLAIAQTQKIPLFDSPLFRFIEAESKSDGTLHLVLGDTGYKEYVTTRVPEFAQGRKRQELGNALSVCSVVETSDDYILLDKRQGVDVYVGRYHVIGGFFDRDRDSTASKQPDPFGAIRREIRGHQPRSSPVQHKSTVGFGVGDSGFRRAAWQKLFPVRLCDRRICLDGGRRRGDCALFGHRQRT